MLNQRNGYPRRKLPSIKSSQSIHIIERHTNKTIAPDKQTPRNLSPYLTDIQRRKRVRSVLKDKSQRSKSPNDSNNNISSKKFRIQECSYYPNSRNNSTLVRKRHDGQLNTTADHTIITMNSATNTIERRRGPSRHKILPQTLTLQRPSVTIIDDDLKDLYSKLKAKCASKPDKQQICFRRGKYVEQEQEPDITIAHTELRKIAHTVNNIDKNREIDLQQLINCNKTVVSNVKSNINHDKKNFRRNKYEVQSQVILNQQLKETKYSSVDFQKKESNTSLIRQLDLQTQKQTQQQDRVINLKIKKILDKSIQKSTEQYFRETSAQRHLKSRNQIEIYMSTVKNPSVNRCSQASTLNMSDRKDRIYVSAIKQTKNQDFMSYDFNLEQQVIQSKPVEEVKSPRFILPQVQQDQSSVPVIGQLSQFDKERRQAERRFIDNDQVRMSWSQEQELDCTVKAQQPQN